MSWFASNSNRVFILYPVLIIVLELLLRTGNLQLNILGVTLLAWGYLQFRFTGKYRNLHGGGGPGLKNPPERLVTTGIYAYTRNPMYLGHFIFITGLAVTFHSIAALLLLIFTIVWYQRRVGGDESRLSELFGEDYDNYRKNVKRWVPGLF
jgi:protein-S-isoprenylcysteine O-methyltransferase Ste14